MKARSLNDDMLLPVRMKSETLYISNVCRFELIDSFFIIILFESFMYGPY